MAPKKYISGDPSNIVSTFFTLYLISGRDFDYSSYPKNQFYNIKLSI